MPLLTVPLPNDDRFIPFGNSIYAFSKGGSYREWTLPERFRGKSLKVFSLTKKGRGPAPLYSIKEDKIYLRLTANIPVKIEIREAFFAKYNRYRYKHEVSLKL